MSCPVKQSNSDIMKDNPKVVDKTTKPVRKCLSSIPAKSKIPKQGKLHISSDVDSMANVVLEKQYEKPPTPSKSLTSQSHYRTQEKPSTAVSNRVRSIVSIWGSESYDQKRVLENKFNQKKNRFISLEREIQDKQKLMVTSYKELYQTREKILSAGGKDPAHLDEMNPLGFWFFNAKIEDSNVDNDNKSNDNNNLIVHLATQLGNISDEKMALLRESLKKRKEVVDWLMNFEKDYWDNPLRSNFKEETIHQREIFQAENAEFEKRLERLRDEHFFQLKELVLRMSILTQECHIYRINTINDTNVGTTGNCEEELKDLRAEKEKLMKARTKLRDQVGVLTVAEKKLKQTEEQVKQLESQIQQKQANLDCKSKELAKIQKMHDAYVVKMEKQRENLESRIIKIKEELEFKDNELKTLTNESKKKFEKLSSELENEKKSKKKFESQTDELKTKNIKLEKCHQMFEAQDKHKEASLDNHHTEYEMQLFSDLKEAQNILSEKEKIIQKLQMERKDLMESINEGEPENNYLNKKFTIELMKKTSEIQTLKAQLAQFETNYKILQQKTEHYEKKLSSLNKIQTQLKDGNRNVYSIQVMPLQQQVIDLTSTLADVNAQNEELEKKCIQLQLKLEHQKRYICNQEKDSKVRKEMQQLLHCSDGTHQENIDENIYKLINADEAQQIYKTLEMKEMQIMKLEKLVKQMEMQEENSQLQRTRLEARIANLEIALNTGQQSNRNRGFSFL